MNPRLFLAKLGRRYFRRYSSGRNRAFVRNHFRKWCVRDELPTWTNEGFRMLVSPHDYMSFGIFFFGEYDRLMSDFLKFHVPEGATCWDVGTERGWFTLLMGSLVGPSGRVDGFEAFPPNHEKLIQNIAANGFTWVNTYNAAISYRTDKMYFVPPSDEVTHQVNYLEDCGGVGYLTSAYKDGCIEVGTITLDDHAEATGLSRLDFVKLDIEGAEVAALQGGECTIRKFKPIIAVEYNRDTALRAGTSVEELDALLNQFGYDRFTFSGRLTRFRLEEWKNRPDSEMVFNVYCLPR